MYVLGAVMGQEQDRGTVRPLRGLSWSTLRNKQNWGATILECAAITLAVKKKCPMFYGVPFMVVSVHQPLKNLDSLAAKVNRV